MNRFEEKQKQLDSLAKFTNNLYYTGSKCRAKIIDPNFTKHHNIDFYIDSIFYRISCLGTTSLWYRLKYNSDDIICLGAFGESQIEIIDE